MEFIVIGISIENLLNPVEVLYTVRFLKSFSVAIDRNL
jgi:hypothetical protein